jgi:hypothetical protein
MESHKLCVKVFLTDASVIPHDAVVPVFHSWIQTHAVPEHLLIDVADYAHVHNGPGVVLVSAEANFSLETVGGQAGLLYQRKTPLPGPLERRIATVMEYARASAERLENDPRLEGKLTFKRDQFLFRIADRLNAPNTKATFDSVRPALEAATHARARLEHKEDSERMFEVMVTFE